MGAPASVAAVASDVERIIRGYGALFFAAFTPYKADDRRPTFTLSWLFGMLDRAMGLPPVRSSDGDDLMFHDVRFPLAKGVTQNDIATRMNAIPVMAQENVKFWSWLEDKPKSRGKQKQADAVSFDTIMDNGMCVLGDVELKGRFLRLSTNSDTRAQKGTDLIRQALGDLVGAPLTEVRTVEQMMAERPPSEHGEAVSDLPPEIVEQAIPQFMGRQCRETPDQPVGMLGNKTPRQVAKSAAGWQKVAEWLKYL